MFVGVTLLWPGVRKSIGYSKVDSRIRIRQDCNADGDCVRLLDKVKACDVALIKQMKLSE